MWIPSVNLQYFSTVENSKQRGIEIVPQNIDNIPRGDQTQPRPICFCPSPSPHLMDLCATLLRVLSQELKLVVYFKKTIHMILLHGQLIRIEGGLLLLQSCKFWTTNEANVGTMDSAFAGARSVWWDRMVGNCQLVHSCFCWAPLCSWWKDLRFSVLSWIILD